MALPSLQGDGLGVGSVTKHYSADFYVITRKASMHYPTAKANATEQKDYRKALRNNMTAAEATLWRVANEVTDPTPNPSP